MISFFILSQIWLVKIGEIQKIELRAKIRAVFEPLLWVALNNAVIYIIIERLLNFESHWNVLIISNEFSFGVALTEEIEQICDFWDMRVEIDQRLDRVLNDISAEFLWQNWSLFLDIEKFIISTTTNTAINSFIRIYEKLMHIVKRLFCGLCEIG